MSRNCAMKLLAKRLTQTLTIRP